MGYRGTFAYYSKESDNNWATNGMPISIDYRSPFGLILGVNATYIDAEDPYGNDTEYKLGVPKTERCNSNLSSKIGFQFSRRLTILLYYNYAKQDYKDNENDYGQDYNAAELGIGFQMRFLPKTSAFFRYHYGSQEYYTNIVGVVDDSNNADFDKSRMNSGITWDSGARINGEFNIGYQWTNYENEYTPEGSDRYNDEAIWIAGTNIGFDIMRLADGTLVTKVNFFLSRHHRQSSSNSNNYYENTLTGISLNQTIHRKIKFKAGISYGIDEYYLNSRKDENSGINVGFGYSIHDWLSISVGYAARQKKSDSDSASDGYGFDNEYTNNKIKLMLSWTY